MHTTQPSVVMKYYQQYEKLAHSYAKEVYNLNRIGFDLEDLAQELRLKIYTSILAYAKKWAEYRQTGRYQPVPLEIYIRSSLRNKCKDFIKEINETPNALSIEATNFDYSEVNSMFSMFNPNESIAEINGVNLVEGLDPMEKRCFILYLCGFPIPRLKKTFRTKIFDVESLITNKVSQLKKVKSQLTENMITSYKTYDLQE